MPTTNAGPKQFPRDSQAEPKNENKGQILKV